MASCLASLRSASSGRKTILRQKAARERDTVAATACERELEALRRVRREYGDSPLVFATERGGPLTRSTVNKLIERAGRLARLEFPVHPHMLRNACGFALANKGVDTRTIQDYLGHKSIQHTVKYTQLTPQRFRGLWR